MGAPVPDGFLIADGHCVANADYPELADVLHDGDMWPYGKCDDNHFHLPNTCDKDNKCMIIKVK